MTNEQLAVLLSSYSKRLKVILDDIEIAFPADVARVDEWWCDEERISASFSWGMSQEGLESKGYELRPTGHVLALDGLREFISDLLRDTSRLSIDALHLSADARSRISARLGAGAGKKTS